MKTVLASMFFLAGATAQASDIKFEGSCHNIASEEIELPFNVEFGANQRTLLPVTEIDSFGNAIVTNVIISFPPSSLLAVRLSTDMPAPFNGDVSAYGVEAGATLRATFPLRLGGQVECRGNIVLERTQGEQP